MVSSFWLVYLIQTSLETIYYYNLLNYFTQVRIHASKFASISLPAEIHWLVIVSIVVDPFTTKYSGGCEVTFKGA